MTLSSNHHHSPCIENAKTHATTNAHVVAIAIIRNTAASVCDASKVR